MLICPLVNHNRNPIVSVCTDPQCNSTSGECERCQEVIHKQHRDKLLSLEMVEPKLTHLFNSSQDSFLRIMSNINLNVQKADQIVETSNYRQILSTVPQQFSQLNQLGLLIKVSRNQVKGFLKGPYQDILNELDNFLRYMGKEQSGEEMLKSLLFTQTPISLRAMKLKCEIHKDFLQGFCINQECQQLHFCTKCSQLHKGHLREIVYFENLDFKSTLSVDAIQEDLSLLKNQIQKKLQVAKHQYDMMILTISNNQYNSQLLSKIAKVLKISQQWNGYTFNDMITKEIYLTQAQLVNQENEFKKLREDNKLQDQELNSQYQKSQMKPKRYIPPIDTSKQDSLDDLIQQDQLPIVSLSDIKQSDTSVRSNNSLHEIQIQSSKNFKPLLSPQNKLSSFSKNNSAFSDSNIIEDSSHVLAIKQIEDLKKQGKWEEALAVCVKTKKTTRVLLLQGSILIQLKLYKEALEILEQGIMRSPKHYLFHFYKAIALENLNQFQYAINSYETAIECKPGIAKIYFYYGQLFFKLNEYEQAIRQYNKMLEINPDCTNALNHKANALNGMKKYRQALKCYDQCLKYHESPIIYNNKGLALENLNSLEDALECYKKAIALDPNYLPALQNYGMLIHKQGKLDQALRIYNEILQKDQNNYQVINNKGCILQKFGRHQEALECFDSYLHFEANPLVLNNKGLNEILHLGLIFQSQKQYKKAMNCFRKSIDMDPNLESTQNYISQLQNQMNETSNKH